MFSNTIKLSLALALGLAFWAATAPPASAVCVKYCPPPPPETVCETYRTSDGRTVTRCTSNR